MGILEEQLRGESLADYTNEQLRISLNTALYTNTADMWKRYLEQQGYSGSVADMMAKWWAANNVPPQFRNYINSGLYLFNPRQLFQDGSIGVLYDNNDFVEPTTWRRNLLTWTQEFDNAAWVKIRSSATANAAVAPDGTLSAEKIIESTDNNNHAVLQTIASNAGTIYTFSVYLKAAERTSAQVRYSNNGDTQLYRADINLLDGTFTTGLNGGASNTSTTVTNAGNGWWRVQLTVAAGNTGFQCIVFTQNAFGNQVYAGDGVSGIFIWGAQLERGSTATDYQRITDFNSDFLAAYPNTTLFLDASGTTPATVNGLVGLQLDKSANLALGAELVTNGDFSGGTTGWVLGAGWSVSGGAATSDGLSTNTNFYTSAAILVVGRYYEVTYTLATVSAGGIQVYAGLGSGGPTRTTPGTYTDRLLCQSTTALYIYNRSNFVGTVDNVSVKEVAGNHRYQATTGSKPILRGTPTGGNLVTNGDFASGTGWALTSGATISGGTLNLDGNGAPSNVLGFQNIGLTTGKTYLVRCSIASVTGSVQVWDNGGTPLASFTTTGAKEFYFTHNNASGNIVFRAAIGANTASIDNVQVFDVSAGSVTAPYGLQYEVDDFMQTAPINFSATDKITAIAGGRTFPVTASGTFVELGNSSTTSGSFAIGIDSAAGNAFLLRGFGTATGAVFEPSGTVPRTSVVSGLFDISQATTATEMVLRVNGVVSASIPLGGPLGTGNFGNHILYFGRRAGTSQPFSGLDFGFVIVGKTLTAAQIASTERWMAQRTGVSI